jgi:hypothetical protein
VIAKASVAHHVVVVELLRTLVVELLLRDLAVQVGGEPALDIFFLHKLTFDIFLVDATNQAVIRLQVHLNVDVDALEGLEHYRCTNDPLFIIEAAGVAQDRVALLHERLAKVIGHVGEILFVKHFGVVGGGAEPEALLHHQQHHRRDVAEVDEQLDADPRDSSTEPRLHMTVIVALRMRIKLAVGEISQDKDGAIEVVEEVKHDTEHFKPLGEECRPPDLYLVELALVANNYEEGVSDGVRLDLIFHTRAKSLTVMIRPEGL